MREYGLDLADPEVVDRTTWRRLNVLVAGLSSDSLLATTLRRRAEDGDIGPTDVIESEEDVNAWLVSRFGRDAVAEATN